LEAPVSPDPSPTHVRVWDLPVRLFHWSIVLLIAVSWISADRGYMQVHLVSGLTLLALLLFRIAWGVLGSTTARFRDFLHPPGRIIGYLKGRDGDKWYAGHNPAGGLMVAALILVLLTQVGTGLFANDGVRFHGPLALLVSEDTSTRLTGIHGFVFDLILVLIWCHIVAVGFYLLVKGHNLIGPMVTGKKRPEHVPPDSNLIFVRSYIALLLFAVSAGIAVWVMAQGGYAL